MEVGLVRKIDIDQEMQQAYLDYAMSVIVARALPDARDGLKPVHRRILYAMYDMGLRPATSYKKSARVVGEVLGKYHPHSDTAVYDAMVRMAQDFSMRYELVDGQGNFGSVDGDPPAAMRYTEARMAGPAMDLMADIAKDTVDYSQNFDDTLQEPNVLPAALPNLLLNGASGIAVGMSTNIPPHNLGELVQAIHYMLANWKKVDDVAVEDLMQFIQGPDFPTGGLIIQQPNGEGLANAYGTGRGRIKVQARAHVEDMARGRQRIIVTELPYQTNKASLIERIASLVRDGRLEGISDLRDESDRSGMRVVIELSKNAIADKVLADLYKRTPMQGTFGIIILALVDGEPRLLNLKQALKVYIEHRLEVVKRRSQYDLDRAKERAHILEGYLVGLENLDEVIQIIRKSRDVNTARNNLMKKYKLSEIQAQAILDMPLRRLAALERKKIETEYKDIQKTIKELTALLKSPVKMRQVVADELDAVKETYGDRRRTQIVELQEGQTQAKALTTQDLVEEKTVWVSVTTKGIISRSIEDKAPRPSGRAAPQHALRVSTKDTLYLVTETGKTAAIAAHTLPEAVNAEQGEHFSRVSPLFEKDELVSVFSLPAGANTLEDWYVVVATPGGLIKKSPLNELTGPAAQTTRIVKPKKGDRVGWVGITNGKDEVMLLTKQGMAIRFKEDEVRPMGLLAAGVNAVKLKANDAVVGMEIVDPKADAFILASDGQAKRVKMSEFPTQGRYGQGVIAWKLEKSQELTGLVVDKPNLKVTVHLRKLAAKSTRLDEAPQRNRPASGQPVLDVKDNDEITFITVPLETNSELAKLLRSKGKTNGRKKAAPAKKAPAKKVAPAKKKSAAKKPAAKKAPAKKTTTRKKAASTKKTTAKKPAAKKPATGKTTRKKK